jgi:hypothetical protein
MELQRQRQRAEELRATLLYDRTDGEPLCSLTPPDIPSVFSSVLSSDLRYLHTPAEDVDQVRAAGGARAIPPP